MDMQGRAKSNHRQPMYYHNGNHIHSFCFHYKTKSFNLGKLSAEEAEIRVNIFQSLMKRRFILKRITLSDSEFSILREVDGSLRLEGGD